jgi:hypothetical protein
VSDIAEKPPTLEYAAPNRDPADPGFRRVLTIYCIGVAICCAGQLYLMATWPGTSNSLAPGKAENFMASIVLGWLAVAWLVLGLRRILISRAGRRDLVAWLLVFANLVAALPILSTTYQ